MQTARYFIAALTELRAGMENRHNDFHGRQPFLGVKVDRDAPSVIFDRARAVGKQYDLHGVRVPRHRLVDGVIDRLVDELMQPAFRGVANIHARALTHRLQPTKDLDLLTSIVCRHQPFRSFCFRAPLAVANGEPAYSSS